MTTVGTLTFRRPRPEELETTVGVLLTSAPSAVQPYLAYAQAGYVRHLVADARTDVGQTRFSVAVDGDRIVGAIDVTVDGGSAFLNYVAVAEAWRRQGLGSSLLGWALDQVRDWEPATLALDVEIGNAPAAAWYTGLGLVPTSYTAWWDLQRASDNPTSERWRIDGIGAARAAEAASGIGSFTIATPRARHTVTLLGGDRARIHGPDARSDPDLLACARSALPDRSLVGVAAHPIEDADELQGPPGSGGDPGPLYLCQRLEGPCPPRLESISAAAT